MHTEICKNGKKRPNTCFIVFQKASNSDRYLKVVRSMYLSSKARIKMLGKISQKIDVLIGTEH